MSTATAHDSSAFRFFEPVTPFRFEIPATEPSIETEAEPLASDIELSNISGPVLVAAKWVPTIERRIRESVPNQFTRASDEDGWLDSQIAEQAIYFFRAISDVLP